MKILSFLGIAIVAVLAASFLIPSTGKMHLKVADPDTLEPLQGVEVVLEGENAWREAETDSLGSVQFIGLPGGVYRVQFRFPGYKKLELKEVAVRISETTELDLLLERKVHGCY